MEIQNGLPIFIIRFDRLTSLVNSLVVFSRMEEKDTVERTSFDLTETLKSRIEDFDELANFQKKIYCDRY